jgi:SAM-dependent methyltransferase
MNVNRREHWAAVYATKEPTEVSWYQARPTLSLALLAEAGASPSSAIIDVGGGDSTLVDALVEEGYQHVTVLDIAGAALMRARERLGHRADQVTWLEADITVASLPAHRYDVWHDRAVFHFLTDQSDRERYVEQAAHAIKPGGALIIATFAADGPTQCSGLEVRRSSQDDLKSQFASAFSLVRCVSDTHVTPAGSEQRFIYCLFRRLVSR